MLTPIAKHVPVPDRFESVLTPDWRVQVKGPLPNPMTTPPSPLTAVTLVLSPSKVKVVGLLGMHLPAVQEKPAAQSALLVQLVLHVVPEAGQTKLLAQARGAGNRQTPALHVPGSTTLGDEQLVLPQLAVGYEQTPLPRHTPLQAANAFDATWQSLLLQQFAVGMQAATPHCFAPVLHTYEHRRLLQVAVALAIAGQSARRLQRVPVVKTADSTT